MKDIIGYEGLYAATEDGKVWSHRSKKFLKPALDKDGYERITLVNGQKKNYYVHRLIALTFIENPNELPQVNHIDENKQNNSISNLEWVSAKQNCNHGSRNDATSKPVYCVELDRVWASQRKAALELGLDCKNISKCCLGIYKTSGGYHWRFYNG